MRAAAARSLGSLKAKEAVAPISGHLTDASEDVAAAAARALGEIASADAVTPLMKVLAKSSTPAKVQEQAANSLAKIKDPRAIPTLIQLLESPKQSTLAAAIDALGGLRAKAAVAPLANVVRKDENPQIRELALAALAKIGDPKAIDVVLEAVSNGEKRVAEQAFLSLILLAEANNSLYAVSLDRLVGQGRHALAEKVLAKAIEHFNAKPNHAGALTELRARVARGLLAAKEWDKARPHFEALVSGGAKDPAYAEYVKGLAVCLANLKDRTAYLALLNQARRSFPQDAHWWDETLRIVKRIAAEGKSQEVVDLVNAIEKEAPKLGGEKTAAALRDLREKAKAKLAPPAKPAPKPA